MQAPLYALKKILLKHSMHIKEEQIIAYQLRWYEEKKKG
jgi:hypothetical protein